MPFDIEKQYSNHSGTNDWGNSKMILLAALTFAALVTSLFLDIDADTHPSAARIALRINHNITSAYFSTQDHLKGEGTQDLEAILFIYNRALGYVKVSLDGGEIDGVPVQPLQNPKLRSEMVQIGQVIGKLKNTTTDFLSHELGAGEIPEFDQIFSSQYSELQKLTAHFSSSSRGFLLRHGKRIRLLQIILMAFATGFVLVILINSKKAHVEKVRALRLALQIEEQRKLAIEGANLGTWDWNISTGEMAFNDRWSEMLGLEPDTVEPHYKTWEKLIHPDDLPRVQNELKVSFSGQSSRIFSEYRIGSEPDHWVWILTLGKVLERGGEGNPLRAAGTNLDITRLKTVEMKLRSEKTRAQQYLDLAGVLFVALDTKGIVTMINRKGCQVLGLPADYIIGRNWMENFVPDRIRKEIQSVANDLMDVDTDGMEYHVNPIKTASGSEALIAWRNTALHDEDGHVVGHLSSGMDITKMRNHELALEKYQRRLQSLAAQLAMTEDQLRQDIASGLHDSIGQNLAALKLSIDLVGLNLEKNDCLDLTVVKKDLEKASLVIDGIVQETWSLSFQLSPPGLYESGVRSALEWLVARYNEKFNCNFILVSQDQPLPREKGGRGLLFQMIRELMLNAVKHGGASEVKISLSSGGNYILASVVDNGSGFETDAVMTEEGDVGGFGLFSIKERLAYISGSLEVDSTVGEGTRVVIRFPLGKINNSEVEISGEN